MSDKECLIKKFAFIKKEYVKAFKAKLFNLCRKLGDQLIEIANQLKEEGLKFSDLGLSNDGEYIYRSISLVAQNPTSEFADNIFTDARRLACENCNGKCEETKLRKQLEDEQSKRALNELRMEKLEKELENTRRLLTQILENK